MRENVAGQVDQPATPLEFTVPGGRGAVPLAPHFLAQPWAAEPSAQFRARPPLRFSLPNSKGKERERVGELNKEKNSCRSALAQNPARSLCEITVFSTNI